MVVDLPEEVLLDFVFPFLDFTELCKVECVTTPVLKAPHSHWNRIFIQTQWSNVVTQTIQRGVSRGEVMGGKIQYRDGILRERAACVVELGSSVHRIGSAFHPQPRLILRTALDVSLTELLSSSSELARVAMEKLLDFLASIGFTHDPRLGQRSKSLSVLLVVPGNMSRQSIAVLAHRFLSHSSVRRIRFEHSPPAALLANSGCGSRSNGTCMLALDRLTGVVVDLGHSWIRAVPVVKGCVPVHLEDKSDSELAELGLLRTSGGAAMSETLREHILAAASTNSTATPFPRPVAGGGSVMIDDDALEAFKTHHCYARLVGVRERPPTISELDLAAQPIRATTVAEAEVPTGASRQVDTTAMLPGARGQAADAAAQDREEEEGPGPLPGLPPPSAFSPAPSALVLSVSAPRFTAVEPLFTTSEDPQSFYGRSSEPPWTSLASGGGGGGGRLESRRADDRPQRHGRAHLLQGHQGAQDEPEQYDPGEPVPHLALHELVLRAVDACVERASRSLPPLDLQRALLENVCVTGGLSGLPGLDRRLRRDLLRFRRFSSSSAAATTTTTTATPTPTVHIVSGRLPVASRQTAAWHGAARLAQGAVGVGCHPAGAAASADEVNDEHETRGDGPARIHGNVAGGFGMVAPQTLNRAQATRPAVGLWIRHNEHGGLEVE